MFTLVIDGDGVAGRQLGSSSFDLLDLRVSRRFFAYREGEVGCRIADAFEDGADDVDLLSDRKM